MTEGVDATQEKRRNKPTEKMIAAARGAAERHGVKLPDGVEAEFDVCKAFLDLYLSKPSPKALAFAERIAKQHCLALPEAARGNAKDLSAWIDTYSQK